MENFGAQRNHLFRQATLKSDRLDKLLEEPRTLDGDVSFFEQVRNQRMALFAYNEQVRAEHMLLKTALDGVQ
ncbi:hypothetical protein BFW88_03100 [Pseudomonas fluorescens]|uniref:Uncharacterized protein n=1 Tax=Pseudomonas lactucae TaxID=2813360 RepID=A0A9X0Y7J4_9PSED|nr:hypothetical protein [Pseudomonas lactucae]OPA97709.1 hypothetical protein BFW88_03100 [Pseudomonas fluorescens]MBN2974772.1 hypothetical protein [Pseudomonas lactucae]MBN2988010.1 hypothetical protein [Pseudomonas lactucae]OPB13710.1 hypothetical protein BFW92_03090 [Pseudomonas fluorescens]OPB27340.1 hypothetical protein BFW93_03100 [Pseudomonas fluorescens]